MQKISLTELKKFTKYDIDKRIPLEITFDGEVIAKLVPKTWRDPRFIYRLGDK